MALRVGVCGGGWFAECFIPLFQAHPGVDGVSLAEVVPERRERVALQYGIETAFSSFEELCESDVDAIAIFTQRWMHGPQAIHALAAGKHVYSAVPMGITVEELSTIVELAETNRLVYSMGETSYYYPAALYCRERFRRGDFGAFVYGEGEYLHDLSQGFYEVFQRSGGENWKATASFPPMLYPSHSVSIVLSVTGEHMTEVSCLGYRDRSDDGVFLTEVSDWSNTFSNESALFRTSGGGIVRINEMRRVGIPGDFVRVGLFGTDAVFEEAARRHFFIERSGAIEEVTEALRCATPTRHAPEGTGSPIEEDFWSGMSSVHPVGRLPEEFSGLPNGHYGSHQFLVDDFVRAVRDGEPLPVAPRTAASYCVPGILAHRSALAGGERLAVPDFTAAGAS
jgi:predicted dehydrogenase